MCGVPDATRETFDVAIAGASYAGLALAAGLVQALGADIRIALIDRVPAVSAGGGDGRAFAIWAASKNMLDTLGVWTRIAPEAETITAIEITDSALDDGVRQTRLTYDGVTEDGLPVGYIVPADVLHRALHDLVCDHPAITWIAPAEAVALTLDDPSADIALADGRVVRGRLVVAADGRTSRLRDAAGIKTVGWGYGQTGIVTTIALEEAHHGVAIQHFLPGGPFAVLPLKGRRACITWSCEDAEARRVLALDDADFLAEIDKRVGGRFGAVSLAGPRRSWPLDLRIARGLIARRFALAGDAAHGVHPVAGQGVNLALRDVAALVEVLADAARLGFDLGDGSALERYERWRRFDSTLSATVYDGLNRVFGFDNALLRAGRGVALGALDRSGFLKKKIITEAAGLSGDLPRMLKGEPV